jgi:hypothetical protein
MRILAIACLAILLPGCRESKPVDSSHIQATGHCFVSGSKPATGAVLLFHRVGATAGESPPRAQVRADGSFTVVSANGEGLPEAEYRVTVEWRIPGENGEDGRSLVADKFTNPALTPLKANVKAGSDGACKLEPFTLAK